MVFYIAAFSLFLLHLDLGAAGQTACLTPAECLKQSQVLTIIGITDFFTGSYTTSGCFYEGETAYFGLGGTMDSMIQSNLAGERNRIWCNTDGSSSGTKALTDSPTKAPSPRHSPKPQTNSPTKAPSPRPSSKPQTDSPTKAPSPRLSPKPTAMPTSSTEKVCRNQKICNLQRQELGFVRYYVGNYPAKGCYYKGQTAYFGVGGTAEQTSKSSLSGEKQRIWCDSRGNSNQPPLILSPISMDSESPISMADEVDLPEKKYCIDINVVTDKYGRETGFELSSQPEDGSEPEKLVEYAVKSLENETPYSDRVCVPKGKYTFTVNDSFSGLCCAYGKGSYSVSIDGEEVISGGQFQAKTISHDILAGYDPIMNDVDKDWLDGHNTRRKAFHEEHDTKYRPMRWSTELANDASNWVDEILPTCKVLRESPLEAGENMSVKRWEFTSDIESPNHILNRWSDKDGKGYPDNQTMTQVMWRATRFVGCSNKFRKNDDGSYCYVSICRYSRPGNCAVNSYPNWLIPTLDDRTPCGAACPSLGCY